MSVHTARSMNMERSSSPLSLRVKGSAEEMNTARRESFTLYSTVTSTAIFPSSSYGRMMFSSISSSTSCTRYICFSEAYCLRQNSTAAELSS